MPKSDEDYEMIHDAVDKLTGSASILVILGIVVLLTYGVLGFIIWMIAP